MPNDSKGRIQVSVAHIRTIGGDVQWDHHYREPEDLAACVCNCLDWAHQQHKAGNWAWFSVNVTYASEV